MPLRLFQCSVMESKEAKWLPKSPEAPMQLIQLGLARLRVPPKKTGSDSWHADVSYEKAIGFAKDPNVKEVHLNRTLDKPLGTNGVSKQRPDITVIYKDGKTVRVCKCVSPSQTFDSQLRKTDNMNKKIEASGKKTEKADVTRRGSDSDPTGGRSTGSSILSPQAERAISSGQGGLF
jgi:hypothetical protein